ncbi:UDP-2,4-diacetamido-2,4,6-trideoxy-beta-L-altropyranose hydrolase [Clostridium uliginosum]|uniref:UDP-2,4-diacetamido-2,4, 6-trideoxy-beta-L-altropyranose hydrolase n=1 Tax=Clostridium uliginosum TaxID=119641 RepID=UPI000B7C881B|nr:UDP-2,4-diacetamido-2,4,6-trideoxy-beta-L-altropyranose hydrolase [Clostridium uliginosum]
MKFAIRADGGSKIGMGHIMRTLVLAKELAKTNDVFYICKVNNPLSDKYKPGIDKIKAEGFDVICINENNILEELEKINADCLITDSYDVDENYFMQTKHLFYKTGYFDDMNLYYFDVDFIINQNINAEDFKYNVNNDTKLMLGCKYLMLREEFRNVLKKHTHKKVHNIMITVGGADPSNITGEILSWVKDLEYTFHVVIGPSFNSEYKLEKLRNEKVKLYYNADMYQIMKKCDMAISGCGSTLYELAVCGVPTIGIVIADNQKAIACRMHEKEIIINAGICNQLEKYSFTEHIENMSNNYNLRKNMSLKGSELIDNKGIGRILSIIESI